MEPLITLVGVTVILLVIGRLGVQPFRQPTLALRGGLAAMFTLTGIAHFIGMRAEMIAMVPPVLPRPDLLVTVTGVLELAGAAGVLWKRTALWAALGLTLLMILMYPANIYAALAGVSTEWHDQLLPRTLTELVFLGASVTVVIDRFRARRASSEDASHVGVDPEALTGAERRDYPALHSS